MQQSQLFRIWASIAQQLMREPDIRSASLWQVGAADMEAEAAACLCRNSTCVPQTLQLRLHVAGIPLCCHVLVGILTAAC